MMTLAATEIFSFMARRNATGIIHVVAESSSPLLIAGTAMAPPMRIAHEEIRNHQGLISAYIWPRSTKAQYGGENNQKAINVSNISSRNIGQDTCR